MPRDCRYLTKLQTSRLAAWRLARHLAVIDLEEAELDNDTYEICRLRLFLYETQAEDIIGAIQMRRVNKYLDVQPIRRLHAARRVMAKKTAQLERLGIATGQRIFRVRGAKGVDA